MKCSRPHHFFQLFNIWARNGFYYKGPLFRQKLKTLGGKTYPGAGFILPPFTMKDKEGKYKGFEVRQENNLSLELYQALAKLELYFDLVNR